MITGCITFQGGPWGLCSGRFNIITMQKAYACVLGTALVQRLTRVSMWTSINYHGVNMAQPTHVGTSYMIIRPDQYTL